MPMGGNIIAFKEYSIKNGIWGSEWAGMKYFQRLWNLPAFWNVLGNQFTISLSMLVIGFPAPIILALLLNEVRHTKLKRIYQTTFTFPYFISWIVLSGVIIGFLVDMGIVNQVLLKLGYEKNTILRDGDQFRMLLYATDVWKLAGWNSILYLATLSSINPELYEAAQIDGASRWQQARYITWPCLIPIASVLLILATGNIMTKGFDQILNLYNVMVQSKVDIIDTYIFREFISKGTNFSFAAAVGLFKAVINITLLLIANAAIKKMGQEGII